jgi:hypothetical protein
MTTHKKRLDKIEGIMTPRELVLLLVNKARSSGSLQKIHDLVRQEFRARNCTNGDGDARAAA